MEKRGAQSSPRPVYLLNVASPRHYFRIVSEQGRKLQPSSHDWIIFLGYKSKKSLRGWQVEPVSLILGRKHACGRQSQPYLWHDYFMNTLGSFEVSASIYYPSHVTLQVLVNYRQHLVA